MSLLHAWAEIRKHWSIEGIFHLRIVILFVPNPHTSTQLAPAPISDIPRSSTTDVTDPY